MSLIAIALTIAITGFIIWLIIQIPMPEIFRNIIVGVACLLLLVFVLQALGINTGLPPMRLMK